MMRSNRGLERAELPSKSAYAPKITRDNAAKVAHSLDAKFWKKGQDQWETWHWGEKPVAVVDWDDDDYPEYLVECGRLVRIHFRSVRPYLDKSTHPRRERDHMIELSRKVAARSYLAFDPEHHSQRLYMLIEPSACPVIAERFWGENPVAAMPLSDLALIAGGRQAQNGARDYPNVMVKPVGLATAVVYHTNKSGDGPSYYIHHLGEKTAHFPILAVDELGRLWFAGGDYTCPAEGITN